MVAIAHASAPPPVAGRALAEAVEQLPVGVVLFSADGRVVHSNELAMSALGSVSDRIGEPIRAAHHIKLGQLFDASGDLREGVLIFDRVDREDRATLRVVATRIVQCPSLGVAFAWIIEDVSDLVFAGDQPRELALSTAPIEIAPMTPVDVLRPVDDIAALIEQLIEPLQTVALIVRGVPSCVVHANAAARQEFGCRIGDTVQWASSRDDDDRLDITLWWRHGALLDEVRVAALAPEHGSVVNLVPDGRRLEITMLPASGQQGSKHDLA